MDLTKINAALKVEELARRLEAVRMEQDQTLAELLMSIQAYVDLYNTNEPDLESLTDLQHSIDEDRFQQDHWND